MLQLPASVRDEELAALDRAGFRAVRFNIKRGGSAGLDDLENMARRVYDLLGWHVELYIDSRKLDELFDRLIRLPKVSIDHLGLSKTGMRALLRLAVRRGADQGHRVRPRRFRRRGGAAEHCEGEPE